MSGGSFGFPAQSICLKDFLIDQSVLLESIENQMSKTLNKDGTPRKIGSGKTKGAGCFSSTTWSVLKNYIADDVEFPISRVWLRDLGALKEDQAAVKKIAVPTVLPRERTKVSPPEKEKAEEAETSTAKVEKVESSEDEYEPPPLFATKPNKFLQY